MKTIIYTMLIPAMLISAFSCKEMDDSYKAYVVPNGTTYPAKASSPQVYAGKDRLQISWLRGNDPNVTWAVIYWNNFIDSVVVPIPEQGDTISQIIQPLTEGITYSFVIKTFDDDGHVSVPVEISGKAYGIRYQESLLARPLSTALLDANGNLTLQWADADIANGAIRTEIKYTSDNTQQVLHVHVDSTETTIDDYQGGAAFQYRTAFIPDSLAIDTFYTEFATSDPFEFDKKDWFIAAVSSEHPGEANMAKNLIDGTDATRWHANANTSNYPHFVTFDLGMERTIARLGVWGTTNAFNPVDPRGPDVIQFLVSSDNINWADLGTFDYNRLINGEQLYHFESLPKARYVKLVAVSGPERFVVLGEFSVYGY
ncbi:DUF4998 domain-containing protein [Parapedobacter tibetensis]|uniref:DUF4998 domain-containing protein n=1 Tax=Parapedobacter tibetensis TaxID=2972951 RepID=UPI00214D5618|nr:DUF4998 domain-containing protein [Parapedobacter tibetensis]